MSIEAFDYDAYAHSSIEPEQVLFPLSLQFQKFESDLGFVAPTNAEELLADRLAVSDSDFELLMRNYVDECLRSHSAEPHPTSEVYEFRGILANLAHIYYERYTDKLERGKRDTHLEYVCNEYLRTIDEDLRYLNEPAIDQLDDLMVELRVTLPNFPKPSVKRGIFKTNVIQVLSKIDRNISPLWKSIEKA